MSPKQSVFLLQEANIKGPTLADMLPVLDAADAAPQIGPDAEHHLERVSPARLARLNTVARSSPHQAPLDADAPEASTSGTDRPTHNRPRHSKSANSATYSDLEPALSQLLGQSDVQAPTGTPMARDLTEALAALASNKRLLSSMQASRSFSSPDLLTLAQHLHDSGQWEAVADRLQQEHRQEDDQAAAHAESPSGRCAHQANGHYGTMLGKTRQQATDVEGWPSQGCSALRLSSA